jgi:hypothetical protein
MKYRDRRRVEAEIREARRTAVKMEKALDEQYEHLRKLEEEFHADYQPTHSQGPQEAQAP